MCSFFKIFKCIYKELYSLPSEEFTTFYSLATLTDLNNIVSINSIPLSIDQIQNLLSYSRNKINTHINYLIKNELIVYTRLQSYDYNVIIINPYICLRNSSIPDSIIELFNDTKWQKLHNESEETIWVYV